MDLKPPLILRAGHEPMGKNSFNACPALQHRACLCALQEWQKIPWALLWIPSIVMDLMGSIPPQGERSTGVLLSLLSLPRIKLSFKIESKAFKLYLKVKFYFLLPTPRKQGVQGEEDGGWKGRSWIQNLLFLIPFHSLFPHHLLLWGFSLWFFGSCSSSQGTTRDTQVPLTHTSSLWGKSSSLLLFVFSRGGKFLPGGSWQLPPGAPGEMDQEFSPGRAGKEKLILGISIKAKSFVKTLHKLSFSVFQSSCAVVGRPQLLNSD